MWRQGRQVSMRMARGSVSLLSPIFPSGCEGKPGVALESLQGLSPTMLPTQIFLSFSGFLLHRLFGGACLLTPQRPPLPNEHPKLEHMSLREPRSPVRCYMPIF